MGIHLQPVLLHGLNWPAYRHSMTAIKRADPGHARLLSDLAGLTFMESHGSSAKAEDINTFILEKYNVDSFTAALADNRNHYNLISSEGRIAGFSNIICNFPYSSASDANIAKLERIYILKEFYDLKLGYDLLTFNIGIAKANKQQGLWLYVWKGNDRAIKFYSRNGFKVIGSFDYKISGTHSNPNHRMLLEF